MNTQVNQDYSIDVSTDMSDPLGTDGNNVNLEAEMMDEAKKYYDMSKHQIKSVGE